MRPYSPFTPRLVTDRMESSDYVRHQAPWPATESAPAHRAGETPAKASPAKSSETAAADKTIVPTLTLLAPVIANARLRVVVGFGLAAAVGWGIGMLIGAL